MSEDISLPNPDPSQTAVLPKEAQPQPQPPRRNWLPWIGLGCFATLVCLVGAGAALLFSGVLGGNSASSYDERGIAAFNNGDYVTAIADFSRAIELQPNDADAYRNRGSAYSMKGDLDQGIADFN